MKILSLTNEEFNFLHGIFTAAHNNMDELRRQMSENPLHKLVALLEETTQFGDDALKNEVSEFRKKINTDQEDIFKNLAALKVKFDHLTVSDQ